MWKVTLECLLTPIRRDALGPPPDLLTFVFLVADRDAELVKELVELLAEELRESLEDAVAGVIQTTVVVGGVV